MPKFKMVYDILLQENIATSDQFYQPQIADRQLLNTVHDTVYIDKFLGGKLSRNEERRMGLPWSPGLVKRTCTAVGGTLLTARLALQYGLACNTAGGTHHAFPGFGSGFCIFNDLAVAAQQLVNEGTVDRVLVIDLDVHQGDATAFMFRDEPRIFTFSMHCKENFPFRKQTGDLDIELPIGLEDEAYLQQLNDILIDLLSAVNPDLVLYDAGVDPHADDSLGKLALSDNGLWRRDEAVISRCLANGFPIACVIGGGYDQSLRNLALRHTIVHRVADKLYREFSL